MRFTCAIVLLVSASCLRAAVNDPRTVANVSSLPLALDPDFSFRKTKIYTLSDQVAAPHTKGKNASDLQNTAKGKFANSSSSSARLAVQEASLNFEKSYRVFGAVTGADQRQRHGQYFDFFWRAKRPADVTVRFEYKQEKLRAQTQAKEVAYRDIHGTNRSEFRVVGDEFFDDGKVLAWRCLLIEHGRIVAEKRSFLWD
jgi:hypothetical protein